MKSATPMIAVAVVFAGHFASGQSVQGAVTLNDGGVTNLEVVVRDTNDGNLDNVFDNLFPATLPFAGTALAVELASSSRAEFNLTEQGFSMESTGMRVGLLDSRANVQPILYFSVSVNTPYSLSGMLSVDDPGGSGKFVQMSATLADIDTLAVLFHNVQESFGVVDEAFELGQNGGNQNNELSGAASGLLLAGHRYRLLYGTSIYAANSGDSASFIGGFVFSLVPEPSTAWMAITASLLATYRSRPRRCF